MSTSIHVGQSALTIQPSRKPKARKLTDTVVAESLKVERGLVKDQGMLVYKVDKNGKLHPRRVALTADHRTLLVTTNKITSVGKGLRKLVGGSSSAMDSPSQLQSIDISRIDHVMKGQVTPRFRLAQQISSSSSLSSSSSAKNSDSHSQSGGLNLTGGVETAEELSLSIFFRNCTKGKFLKTAGNDSSGNGGMFLESLDLIVPNSPHYRDLLGALQDLLDMYSKVKSDTDRTTLLLEYLWVDMGKDLSDALSSNEWLELCDRLSIPLKKSKLTGLYKEVGKTLRIEQNTANKTTNKNNNNNSSKVNYTSGNGLPLWAVTELLNNVLFHATEPLGMKMVHHDPMQRIWYKLASTDPVPASSKNENSDTGTPSDISNVAYLSFIRSNQKEFKTSLDDSVAKIQVLNGQRSKAGGASAKEDRLTQARFFQYLLSDANDLLDPSKGKKGSDDMTHPLSHYWINSSHDTYFNHSKKGPSPILDEQMYLAALNRGVRALELDVWDFGEEPVIAPSAPHAGEGKNFLKVTDVLKIVRQFLRANPKSYPVILNIENHCNFNNQERLAHYIFKILGKSGLIVVPDDAASIDEADLLPSPQSMKGKVLIMGKRPRVIEDGAKIVNDDFDDENDQYFPDNLATVESRDMDENGLHEGIVIGFDAAGPIKASRKQQKGFVQHTPGELLYLAKQELDEAVLNAAAAETKAHRLDELAKEAERKADVLIKKEGLTKETVKDLAGNIKSDKTSNQENVMLLNARADGEGIEVQEFFADGVEAARYTYTDADQVAIKAASIATTALQRLTDATKKLLEAESQLEKSFTRERDQVAVYQRAAGEARSKREEADYARKRVQKVQQLLSECETSASSAENVVMTAMTEAKISEKRASETEARATRAATKATEERKRADDETRKEEGLEREASVLHEKLAEATDEATKARKSVDKMASMIDRVNEQIKLLEQSSQYVREKNEQGLADKEEKKDTSTGGGRLLSKHAAKIEERADLSSSIQKASMEFKDLEKKRRALQESFEKKAHQWKGQAELAAKHRKMADRSSHAAEELAEQAEEEREAANLRHTACEKAKSHVSNKDSYRSSLQAQFDEAQRAAKEAEKKAEKAVSAADALEHVNNDLPTHEKTVKLVENRKLTRDQALEDYESKKKIKDVAEESAVEAKKLFETSDNVFRQAVDKAAKEDRKADHQLQKDKKAVLAYNHGVLIRKQAEHAMEDARYAQSVATEKQMIVKRAAEYNNKLARVTLIPQSLAKMTFLHKTKQKSWTRSLDLPNTHVHSFSQDVLAEMQTKDSKGIGRLKKFTGEHVCRSFPSWTSRGGLNRDPVSQWAFGCQLVSMNYSTFDDQILKADGCFRKNGSSGYVLKPENLTHVDPLRERKETWGISVLCGSCLPMPESGKKGPISPFVKVTLYDGGSTTLKSEYRTKTAVKNGLNPIFEGKAPFELTAYSPSLSICVFSVWNKVDGKEEFVAAAAVPVSCFREGIRSVPLFDKHHTRAGQHAFACLLVEATLES